nr:manganese efflux pump [Paenibacillus beijingensis]
MLSHFASLLLLSSAVSVDGFGVGVTYGLRRIRIPVLSVLIIAGCSGLVILISMRIGAWLSEFLAPETAKLFGACVLIGIGSWGLFQLRRGGREPDEADEADEATEAVPEENSFISEENSYVASAAAKTVLKLEIKTLGLVVQILRTPQEADIDRSGTISPSEALLLGSALSLDAFGAGLGAAMVGLEPLVTACAITLSSGLFLLLGLRFGFRFSSWHRIQSLSALPGILLILIGISKLF